MNLVITEKPSVAQAIAHVLGATEKKDGYLEGGGYIVSWCVGHLIELVQPEGYDERLKKWTYDTLPIIPEDWKYEVKKSTNTQFKVLKELMHDKRVDEVICATDAGREGELIFRLVYEQAKCSKPIKRLWISSMEESAIVDGFKNLRPGEEYENLYQSALCRQQADWLVGMNGTRLFTVLYSGKVLKVGRVQTPTLAMLVERESNIINFKKEPYYKVHMYVDGAEAVSENLKDRQDAVDQSKDIKNEHAVVMYVKKEEKTVNPPKLYDLTTLQREANKLYGFTAKQTLECAQSLYEKKLMTYPRTDSQFLSDDMEDTADKVIDVIRKKVSFVSGEKRKMNINRVLDSKKVSDHHALLPTMELIKEDLDELTESERRLLFLVANRLICATGEKHIYETTKVLVKCKNKDYTIHGRHIIQNGWKEQENALKKFFGIVAEDKEEEEQELPEFVEGQLLLVNDSQITEHFTTPPKHYSEDTLLSAMERAGALDTNEDVERKGLGTPATRADIIEKLVKDGFIRRDKKQMIPTDDGMKLITVLPDMIKSPKLTAEWENTLSLIAKGEFEPSQFMNEIETLVKDLVNIYHEVGEDEKKMFQNREVLGKCPNCGADVVVGKYGPYCSEKCGMSFGKVMGAELTRNQIKQLLLNKSVYVKGMRSKKGNTFDAYVTPDGIGEYSYTKGGNEIHGKQFRYKLDFSDNR